MAACGNKAASNVETTAKGTEQSTESVAATEKSSEKETEKAEASEKKVVEGAVNNTVDLSSMKRERRFVFGFLYRKAVNIRLLRM